MIRGFQSASATSSPNSLRVWPAALFLLLVCFGVRAENGPFGVPTYRDYQSLSQSERAAYEKRLDELSFPSFVLKSHFQSASYFATPEGALEFRRVAHLLNKDLEQYGRLVSIGRSGTGLLAYVSGFTKGGKKNALTDLPFSYPDKWNAITDEQHAGLRRHLTRNGLDPQSIAAAELPILFYDFVYSGGSAYKLLLEIHTWAKELKIVAKVKKKIHFIGFFPAETKAREILFSLHYQTIKEFGGSYKPEPPSEKYISEQATGLTSSSFSDIQKIVDKASEPHVLSSFYNYLGTHGPNAHESLRPEKWTTDVSLLPPNSLKGQAASDGHLELYYLFKEGELDALGGCQRWVEKPAAAAFVPASSRPRAD